jgi:hypothetical protein
MLAGRDNVPTLPVGRPAVGDLDWSQVGAEVAREFVNKEAFSV